MTATIWWTIAGCTVVTAIIKGIGPVALGEELVDPLRHRVGAGRILDAHLEAEHRVALPDEVLGHAQVHVDETAVVLLEAAVEDRRHAEGAQLRRLVRGLEGLRIEARQRRDERELVADLGAQHRAWHRSLRVRQSTVAVGPDFSWLALEILHDRHAGDELDLDDVRIRIDIG